MSRDAFEVIVTSNTKQTQRVQWMHLKTFCARIIIQDSLEIPKKKIITNGSFLFYY